MRILTSIAITVFMVGCKKDDLVLMGLNDKNEELKSNIQSYIKLYSSGSLSKCVEKIKNEYKALLDENQELANLVTTDSGKETLKSLKQMEQNEREDYISREATTACENLLLASITLGYNRRENYRGI